MTDKHQEQHNLAESISTLACAVALLTDYLKCNSTQLILNRIAQAEDNIMSALTDFLAKQKAFNDRQSTAIDSTVASITGLTGDIQTLNDKITELQNSQGGVTPEDQVLIDELQTQGEAVAAKAEALATALAALDAQTPPAPTLPPQP